ncbi:MAG: HEAT repeat domain-containing protein [Chloroflexi bacterium]|nr:HEAT repeat domain-containing protein [Chloroflexota bacterium]
MNLFRKSKTSLSVAPVVSLDLLPILKTEYDPARVYIVPRVRDANDQVTHLDNAARQHARILLTGAAGMGKSSALQFIAAHAGHGATLQSFADFHPQALPEQFQNAGWILFDDVTEPAHIAHLETLAQKYPNAKICATAPDAKHAPAGFTAFALEPLNEREMISFAHAWFPQSAAHEARLNRAAQNFIASVQANAGTRELALTPLYLFLLLQVYEPAAKQVAPVPEKVALPVVGTSAATPFDVPQRVNVSTLPARRAQLFDMYVHAKLARENDPEFAARALEGIALSTKRGQLAQADHLARGYGYLCERANGRIAFKHTLLQDFLAARALRLSKGITPNVRSSQAGFACESVMPFDNPDFAPLREMLLDPAWREVALFYAGLGGADAVAAASLEGGDVPPERLYLAAYALAATTEPNPALLEQVVKSLVARAWDDRDENAIRALGELRSNQASDFFAAKLRDKNADVRLRAAYILGHLHTDRALEYLLSQLRDPSTEVRERVIAALGQSRSERVVEPLLVALRGDPRVASSDTRMKIAAAQALGEYGADKSVPALLVDLQVGGPELQAHAQRALEKIRSPFAVKPLQAIAATDKRDAVRQAAARVLQDMAGM